MLLTTLTSSQWPQARAPSSGPWTAQPKRQDSACNHLNATGHCHFDTICCVSVVDGWISMSSGIRPAGSRSNSDSQTRSARRLLQAGCGELGRD
ncbi:unnamed protein product [Gadus morhua 'NCC']